MAKNDLWKVGALLGALWLGSRVLGNGGAPTPFGGGFGGGAATVPDTLASLDGGDGDEDIGTTSSTTLQQQELSTQAQPVPRTRAERRVFTQPNVSAPVISGTSQGRFIATGTIPRLGAGESATIPSRTATARVLELRRQRDDAARRRSAQITGDFISTGDLPVIAPGKSVTVPSSVARARVEELRNRARLARRSDDGNDFSQDEDIGATSRATSDNQRRVDRFSLGDVVG